MGWRDEWNNLGVNFPVFKFHIKALPYFYGDLRDCHSPSLVAYQLFYLRFYCTTASVNGGTDISPLTLTRVLNYTVPIYRQATGILQRPKEINVRHSVTAVATEQYDVIVCFLYLLHHTSFTLVAGGVALAEWMWASTFVMLSYGDCFKSLFI